MYSGRHNYLTYRSRQVVAISVASVILVACDSSKPRDPEAAGSSSAPVPVPAAMGSTLAELQSASPIAPASWTFVDGAIVKPDSSAAKVLGQKSIILTPTASFGSHRIGFERDFDGPGKFQITVWIKASAGLQVAIEAGGKKMVGPGQPADYAFSLFDLSTNALAGKPSEKNFKSATVSDDGGWKKITADFSSEDGAVLPNIALASGGSSRFLGTPGAVLTVGGVEIAKEN